MIQKLSRPSLFVLLACLAAGLANGCGPSRPATAPVRGKITCGGQAVTEGMVTFYPEQGRSASGRIQSDGTYALTTFDQGDGAVLGKHKVTIEAVRFTGGAPAPTSMEEEIRMAREKTPASQAAPKAEWLVPQRYSTRDSSDLTYEVKTGQNTADFDVPRQ